MKQLIVNLLWGKPKEGIPVSQIRQSTHTTMPDVVIPVGKMHEVLYDALEKVRKRLAEVD